MTQKRIEKLFMSRIIRNFADCIRQDIYTCFGDGSGEPGMRSGIIDAWQGIACIEVVQGGCGLKYHPITLDEALRVARSLAARGVIRLLPGDNFIPPMSVARVQVLDLASGEE